MKQRNFVYLKSTLRQPLQSLLLLLLIGLISFAFTSRATEWVLLQREIAKIGEYYRSIGTVTNTNPDNFDVTEAANLIAQSDLIELEDRRRSCSGALNGLYNCDITSYGASDKNINNVFIYGSFEGVAGSASENLINYTMLNFTVDRVEAGYPEWVTEGESMTVRIPADDEGAQQLISELEAGERYFIRACYEGSPDLFKLYLIPLTEGAPYYVQVAPGESVDLDAPELAGLSDELALIKENQRAMLVRTTKDMSAMPDTQQESRLYYLTEGRWLTLDDNENSRKVCVVHSEFADLRGLSLGDTITLILRDIEIRNLGYILGEDNIKNWQSALTHTETFEIVGLYGLDSSISPNSARNTIMYIPDSCMPMEFGNDQESEVTDYSFVLKSAQVEDDFILEYSGILNEKGFSLSFVENNADNFWASAAPMLQSSTYSVIVFAAVLVVGLVLAAFIYLRLRRKEFAVQRALGVSKRSAVRKLLFPIALIGLVAVCAGGISAWIYAMDKAVETLAAIPGPEGTKIAVELSPLWLAGICAAIFASLLIFIGIGSASLSKRPVLELLQGAAGRKKAGGGRTHIEKQVMNERADISATDGSGNAENTTTTHISDALTAAPTLKNTGFAVSSRFVLRHILRAPFKTLLTLSLSLGFVLALGIMDITIAKNRAEAERLSMSTVVDFEIVKSNPNVFTGSSDSFINAETVQAVLDGDYAGEYYLESQLGRDGMSALVWHGEEQNPSVIMNIVDRESLLYGLNLVGIEDAELFEQYNNASIEFAEGWNAEKFEEDHSVSDIESISELVPIIIHSDTLTQLGAELGDVLYAEFSEMLGISELFHTDTLIIAGQYSYNAGSSPASYPVYVDGSYLSAIRLWQQRFGYDVEFRYSKAEFVLDPNRNAELDSIKEEITDIVSARDAGVQDLSAVFWDEELRTVVQPLEQNIRLLSVLYPVTAVFSVLISVGMSVMLLMQGAKETAALRALGCTKRRVTLMLCAQQAVLSLAGVILGLITLIIIDGSLTTALGVKALICAGAYFLGAVAGAAVTCALILRRKPMELLQVKE